MHDQLFDIIRKDHQEVRGIFKNLLQAKKPELRDDLVAKLHKEIMPHMRAEERVVYSMLRSECRDCTDDVLESMEEHHAARLILNELQEISPEDERFTAKATVLHEMIEHHIEEEEEEIFEDLKKNVSDQKAGEILKKFKEEKERVKKSLH